MWREKLGDFATFIPAIIAEVAAVIAVPTDPSCFFSSRAHYASDNTG
jgi:hypothetical protein